MAERAQRGAWVEVRSTVLEPGERAPGVPEDTRKVALELKVKGLLVRRAALGDEVEVITASGRRLRGTLVAVNPAYSHGFGPPIAELLEVGREARELLAQTSSDAGGAR